MKEFWYELYADNGEEVILVEESTEFQPLVKKAENLPTAENIKKLFIDKMFFDPDDKISYPVETMWVRKHA